MSAFKDKADISNPAQFSVSGSQRPAGTRPDPAVSVPSASGTNPAATATAEPELDPPGINSELNVFCGMP